MCGVPQVNERDSAKLEEIKEASSTDDGKDNGDGDEDGLLPMVEVANRRVGSMVRMATIDK